MTTHHNAERGPWLKPGITERLTELHAASGMGAMSMSEIAAKLAFEFEVEITRNAVIGRSRRMGLLMRFTGKRPRPAPPRKKKRRPRKRLVVEPMPIPPIETAAPGVAQRRRVTIYDLGDRVCHWPLGPVDDRPPYFYCGKPRAFEGCSYCGEHYERAHA